MQAIDKDVFMLGTLGEMVTFFFFKGKLSSCLPGYYGIRVAPFLSALQESTNTKALEQWKMTVKIILWDVTLAVLSNLFPTPLGQPEYALSNLASLPGKAKITRLLENNLRWENLFWTV